jgi:hypothetical protein
MTGAVIKEGGVDRFEELQVKAASEGLTDEEAAELGRLYAERRGEKYEDSESIKDAEDAEEEESEEHREVEAAKEAEADEERDRSQAIPPGEAREPDYDEGDGG